MSSRNFAIGFGLVWVSKRIDLGLGDISKAAAILLPIVVFFLVTGKIAEFEDLGWKAPKPSMHYSLSDSSDCR